MAQEGNPLSKASNYAPGSSFYDHTPVMAGNETHDHGLLHMGAYNGLSWEQMRRMVAIPNMTVEGMRPHS